MNSPPDPGGEGRVEYPRLERRGRPGEAPPVRSGVLKFSCFEPDPEAPGGCAEGCERRGLAPGPVPHGDRPRPSPGARRRPQLRGRWVTGPERFRDRRAEDPAAAAVRGRPSAPARALRIPRERERRDEAAGVVLTGARRGP